MWSWEYSTTPKGEDKRTCILQKGDIRFYRKCREFSHNSGILHLADKASPTFRTQKNGVKNATVTQCRTTTTLCPVHIWAEIIIRLDSYLGIKRDTPVNTVWVESQKNDDHLTNDNKFTKVRHTFLWRRETGILTQRGGHPLHTVRVRHGTLSG